MDIFFDGWSGLIRIALSAPVIYFAVILFVRLSGKRSTSQMNNFDWIVTVAIGSISGSGILLEDVTISDAALAVGLLLGMQWLLTKALLHSDWLKLLVKAEPTILVRNGEYLWPAMRDQRITQGELLAAARHQGLTSIDEAQWIILENDATFSVIPKGAASKSERELPKVVSEIRNVR